MLHLHLQRKGLASTRIFATKVFARLARAEGVAASALIRCVIEAEDGLVEANLGRGLIKQRVAKPGKGKSGGLRTILLWRRGDLAIFLDIFAKRDKANLSDMELKAFRKLAGIYFSWTDEQIAVAVAKGELIAVQGRLGGTDGKENKR